MGSEWREVRIGDLVASGALAVSDGYRVRNEELGPIGIPFVRGGDIRDGVIETTVADHIRPEFENRVGVKLARPGDVAFISKGTVGRVGRMRTGQPSIVFAPQVSYYRVLNPMVIDAGFLYYSMCGAEFQASLYGVMTHGSMVADYVSLSQQLDFTMRLPDVGTQRRIARILGALDDKIELNRRISQTLESMARALFKSWFVDFDPVRVKAAGRDPGVPSDIAGLFPDSLENSEVGEIPKGWRTAPVGELAIVAGGSTPSTGDPTYWENGRHYWATPKDLSALTTPVLLATERMITDSGLAQIGSGLLPGGTVLLSSRAPIGYLAIAEVPVAINQGFIAMKPLDGVSNLFLRHWAESAHEEILSQANGSTFLEISKSSFRPIRVSVPPAPVMNAFHRTVGALYRRVVSNDREIQTLAALRDRLLPNLVSGNLRTHNANPLLEVNS